MKGQKFWGIVALALMALILVIVIWRRDTDEGNGIIVRGNIPLTGPIAVYSANYPGGFAMGVKDAEISLGLTESPFKVIFEDNASSVDTAVTVARRQLQAQPVVYVSGTSDMSRAIAPLTDELGIPHFLIAFDAFMASENESRLRVFPHFKLEAPLYVDYAKERDAKNVYVLSLNSPANLEQMTKLVLPELKELGATTHLEQFAIDVKDYRSLAAKALSRNPDLIVVTGFSFNILPILQALRAEGYTDNGNVICTMDTVDLLYNGTDRNILLETAFTCPLFELESSMADTKKWRERFHQQYGKKPSYVEAYAYDTGSIIVRAKQASGEVSLRSIRATIPFEGVTGTILLDEAGDLKSTLVIAKIDSEGKVVESQPR